MLPVLEYLGIILSIRESAYWPNMTVSAVMILLRYIKNALVRA